MLDEFYTVVVSEKTTISNIGMAMPGSRTETEILTTYFDVTWKQVAFYAVKHKAEHLTVERQSKRLGRAPKVERADEIQWSDAAKEGTRRLEEARRKLGGAATSKVSVTSPKTKLTDKAPPMKVGEKVKIDTGYGDLVNAMMKESA